MKSNCHHCDSFEPISSMVFALLIMISICLFGGTLHAADKGAGHEKEQVKPGTGASSIPKGDGAQIESIPDKNRKDKK